MTKQEPISFTKEEIMAYSIRFNNHFMQKQYENLIRDGYHWKTAEKKVIKQWEEN